MAPFYLPPGRSTVVIGWGQNSLKGELSRQLKFLTAIAIDNGECQDAYLSTRYKFEIMNYQLCTLNREGQGTCRGDSGGPLVIYGPQGPLLVGITSWGLPCAMGLPDVFTRISAVYQWIYQHLT